ncbi:hypothetical protein NSK_000793 [Nannochloropsis salina CCMP1776]|uniref:Photosynthesis system II assembly factor Ycf48/Hcf136-like domain-containing protein n=1 Tax=Nannochloropsis salina CCMP1776 TaxID=1027361 RepID=A0A4D9DFH2_9STRA|nr:hypothetical protein NSK_000793 [Nannochloropsis salina CCMP1776]|eukprot:TFJ87439.1 hypothetical protein NSK_000793 [Nannochloropsis salina CCMP1776]
MAYLFRNLLVALLGFASIFTAVPQDCPGLSLKAKVRPSAKRGILAGKGQARLAFTLTSKEPVDNLEFQLNLPNGLSVERTAMRPSPKPFTSPEIVKNADGTTLIYWLNIAFTKSKGGKRRFRIKVNADECAPATLGVDAFAYAVNATGASCITPLAKSAIVRVRYSTHQKATTCAPTPAPTINPMEPFVLVGEGQRFSQGGRLAPFQDRRLSVPPGSNRQGALAALSRTRDRRLQSIDTPEACYVYCSLNAGEATPFYFSWNTVTSQCFCCIGVCTPFIFDPDSSVYEVIVPKTLPPTMQPTAAPTMAPTAAPTMAPTAAPTMAPTAAPTMAPTAAPTMAPTIQRSGSISTSTDTGVSWTTRLDDVPRNWSSIASSSDGMSLAAVVNGGSIWTSTDAGISWTEQTAPGSRSWYSIASSSDGTKLAAVVNGGSIWTSTDAGISWTERLDDESRSWYSIASSSDGMKLAAVVNGLYIWTSTDAGVTWTEQTASTNLNWVSIASSSDGTNLAAVIYGFVISSSTDSGLTWTGRGTTQNWSSIASSSNGSSLAAVVDGGSIWTSTDVGISWTERTAPGSRSWNSIASSLDGTKLAAVVNGGFIWTSADAGVTWTEQTASGERNWFSIASSSNGTNLAAVAQDPSV